MQAKARTRYLKISPAKMRQVAALIKGQPVEKALGILEYTPRRAAHHLAKTVKSAAANAIAAVGTAKLRPEQLLISRVIVDAAPTAKRVRFQSMGRVFRIRKRYCHLLVEVEGEPEKETSGAQAAERKKATRPAADAKARRKTKSAAKGAATSSGRPRQPKGKKAAAAKGKARAGSLQKKTQKSSEGRRRKNTGRRSNTGR